MFLEFDTEANARRFAGYVAGDDDGQREAADVARESVEVFEVVGSA